MKSNLRNLIIVAMTLAIPSLLMAQKANFTTNSGLTLGFGLGGAYQKSDIPNSIGAGFDFTLGHNLGKKEGAFLRPDWKFRFLMGENRAYDHRINTDGTYSNVQYSFFNYDLELGLTLNRLRERTKIVITGFGGAGIVHGRTFTDLYDDASALYDYSTIDPARERSLVYADLLDISDGDFETRLANKAAIMPTLGFYIGYQFSKSFSLGIEHKTSYSLSEENTAWGINMDNNISTSTRKDRNNYTTLGFRWILGGGGGGGNYYTYPTERISNPPVVSLTDNVPARTVARDTAITRTPPVINRNTRISTSTTPPTGTTTTTTNPVRTTTTTTPPTRTTTTTNPVRTTTTTTNPPITSTTSTTPPAKTVPVTVSPKVPLPEIRFINPPAPVAVQNNTFRISAQTSGIKSWDDVELKVNNYIISNFTLSPEGLITTNIGLSEGLNTVEIKGKNESGEVVANTTITYNKVVVSTPAPTVTITQPAGNAFTTYDQTVQLRAQIANVAGRQNIKLLVNGTELSNFDYVQSTGALNAAINLREGPNEIIVNAANEAGSDAASRTVIKETKPCPMPVLTYTIMPVNLADATHELSGTVTNVRSRDEVTMTVDGNVYDGFQYVQTSGKISAKFRFEPGNHKVAITVKTECGQDAGATLVTIIAEEKPCGVRINPGNSDWQFCLVTPSGTFNRNSLTNDSFTYSGTATSLFIMPTAGGGDAIVNGQPYVMRSGQYYLFTGRLKVTVSTKNAGSMGQWSVCIESDTPPVSGNGNNRPKSPCEVEQADTLKATPRVKKINDN